MPQECRVRLVEVVNLSGVPRRRYEVTLPGGGKVYINVTAYSEEEAEKRLRDIMRRRLRCQT